MTISGVTIVRNAYTIGYPFIEAILSALPICDEYIVIDGLSNDKTPVYLDTLKKLHPKIKTGTHAWQEARTGESIAEATLDAISRATGDWILCVQADEIWYPQEIRDLPKLPLRFPKFTAYEFLFQHIGFFKYMDRRPAYNYAIRLFKNYEGITPQGDAWTFNAPKKLTKMVPLRHPIYHAGAPFKLNAPYKHINHALLYPSLPAYQRAGQDARRQLQDGIPEIANPDPTHWEETTLEPPDILKPLVGLDKYEPTIKIT